MIIVLTILLQLLQLIGICSANELSIHIEYLPLWIHEEFPIITLNLYPPHDHIVLHVDTHLLIILICLDICIVMLLTIIGVTTLKLRSAIVGVSYCRRLVVFNVHVLMLILLSTLVFNISWGSVMTSRWMASLFLLLL